jgi:hypothetical protein
MNDIDEAIMKIEKLLWLQLNWYTNQKVTDILLQLIKDHDTN